MALYPSIIDGDGKVTMREARINGIDPDTFAKIDKNGDGFLSLSEFKDYLMQLHEFAKEPKDN